MKNIINSLFRKKSKMDSSVIQKAEKTLEMKQSDEQLLSVQDTVQIDVSETVQMYRKKELEDTVRLSIVDDISDVLEEKAQEQQELPEFSQELFEKIASDSEKAVEDNE